MQTGKCLMYRGRVAKIEKSHKCTYIVYFDVDCKMRVLKSYCLKKTITVYTCLSFITIHKSVIKIPSATSLSALSV
jgi:hypothetical protein